jgi:hypothetical protein
MRWEDDIDSLDCELPGLCTSMERKKIWRWSSRHARQTVGWPETAVIHRGWRARVVGRREREREREQARGRERIGERKRTASAPLSSSSLAMMVTRIDPPIWRLKY